MIVKLSQLWPMAVAVLLFGAAGCAPRATVADTGPYEAYDTYYPDAFWGGYYDDGVMEDDWFYDYYDFYDYGDTFSGGYYDTGVFEDDWFYDYYDYY